MRQTTIGKKEDFIAKKWHIIDATDLILGRMSTDVAKLLIGKHKPNYTPNLDSGDHVVIINCQKVKITGDLKLKKYYNVSGHPGGLRTRDAKTMLEKYPEELMRRAVWGMMPKGKLGRQQIKNLYVYRDENHKHQAQKPEEYKVKNK